MKIKTEPDYILSFNYLFTTNQHLGESNQKEIFLYMAKPHF